MNALIPIALLIVFTQGCIQKQQEEESEVTTLTDNLYGGTGGLSVDLNGNIYSSDFGPFLGSIPNFQPNTKVFKITPEGEVMVFVDSLAGSSGSDFDLRTGTLYQANIRGGFISMIDSKGNTELFSADSIVGPVGVYYNNDEVVVCNCGNNTLRKVDKEGKSELFAKSELFKCPNGITRDMEGNYYVSNFFDGFVLKIDSMGNVNPFAEIPGNNNGHLIFRDNSLYVVARSAHQIYKVGMDGSIELFAGSGERGRKNSSLLESSFNFPNDLDFSPDGKYLYMNELSDTLGNSRVLTPTTVRRLKVN